MKKIAKNIFSVFLVFVLKVFYFFLKLLKTNKNKIVFLSRQSKDISLDFSLIKDMLEKKYNYKIIVLSERYENIDKNIIKNSKYFGFLIKNMYHLATSKIAVIDSYSIPVSVLKHKKQLRIMQIWHSLGANKFFGYQLINKADSRINDNYKIFKLHQNYDAIISTSEKNTEFFSKAFNYPKKYFLEYGLPRIDYLLNNQKEIKKKIYAKYPDLKRKKTILYAPTFRNYETKKINAICNKIDFDSYNLIIKLHPKEKDKKNLLNKNVFSCNDFSSLDLITISDIVVTDYSGIIQEALILNKKIYLYLFDFNKYKRENGLNIDFMKDFPSLSYKKFDDIYYNIENKKYPYFEYKQFKKLYFGNFEGNSTELIVNKIHEWMVN